MEGRRWWPRFRKRKGTFTSSRRFFFPAENVLVYITRWAVFWQYTENEVQPRVLPRPVSYYMHLLLLLLQGVSFLLKTDKTKLAWPPKKLPPWQSKPGRRTDSSLDIMPCCADYKRPKKNRKKKQTNIMTPPLMYQVYRMYP